MIGLISLRGCINHELRLGLLKLFVGNPHVVYLCATTHHIICSVSQIAGRRLYRWFPCYVRMLICCVIVL